MHFVLGDERPEIILCGTSDRGHSRETLARDGRELMRPGEAAAGRAGVVSGCFKGVI